MRLLLVALSLSFAGSAAVAQSQAPQFELKESTARTGSMIRRDVAWSTALPINRTYKELSESERAELRSNYEAMAATDEPPFPANGLKPIIVAIQKAQTRVMARGELRLIVTVGSDGKAKEVSAYGTVDDPKMTKFAASVLMVTQYKAAVCGGIRCTMQFPFHLKLRVQLY